MLSDFASQILVSKSDEWYTFESDVNLIVPYLKIKGYKNILCPFDKINSSFVKVLSNNGFNVTHSHIDEGSDFFEISDFNKYDAVVSNPPFSKRNLIFQKLFQVGIPFALIMNSNGLFDNYTRFEMFKSNEFELLIPKGRMKFFNDSGVGDKPNFQSVYVCSKILEDKIVFSERSKKSDKHDNKI